MNYEDHLKSFEKYFKELSYMHNSKEIFSDFVKMSAISLNNSMLKNKAIENDYLSTIKKYNKDEQELFCKLLGTLVMLYETGKPLNDILGKMYEQKKLGSKNFNQFFTPTNVSDVMSKILVGNDENIKSKIKDDGFITLNEPCSGAGGMVLSFAKALNELGINYQKQLLVVTCDIDQTCTFMTYIQLCLYGIPAVVRCGDTLTQKIKFELKTFSFIMQYYKFRKAFVNRKESNTQDIAVNSNTSNLKLNEKTINGNYQISLW